MSPEPHPGASDRPAWFAAADLGASSGRVLLGHLEDGRFELAEVARFANGPVEAPDGLHWDATGLFEHVREGVETAIARSGGPGRTGLASVGVDTWGVDYGRLAADGTLLEQPFHYRDLRTQDTPAEVFESLPAADLYARAGLQVLPFNTIFQYAAQAADPRWPDVARVLLMPDLLSYWLSGRQVAEVTNASTTGLLDVRARQWSAPTCAFLADRYGLPMPRVLPELVEPGTILGPTLPGVLSRPVSVVAVGSHDTASAVAAVPSLSRDFAFISSGTWSLVGLELGEPVLTPASQAANFTNELGVGHTVRYLKNVMGLWVLNECLREWRAAGRAGEPGAPVGRPAGRPADLAALLGRAAALPPLACVIDMDDDRLLPPGDMLGRVRSMAAEAGQRLDPDPATMTRCVLDSLALAYRRNIRLACALAGREVDVVHIVGGGSQNALLCQLTAEATGLSVVAGPAEGTALGNLLIQAHAMGALGGGADAASGRLVDVAGVSGSGDSVGRVGASGSGDSVGRVGAAGRPIDLLELRRVAVASSELVTYRPGALGIPQDRWDAAERVARPGN